jgi:hypothetical protein
MLFMNGRHWDLTFLLTMQYPLGIPPDLRTNVDYVFILRDPIWSNRKRIWEQYAGMFPSFPLYSQVMDACTENFECLVIHANARSNKLEDQVFWYKAEMHPEFQMCAREVWEHARLHYRRPDDETEYDPTMMRGRQTGPVIAVRKY